ncbi:hypothetical protein [Pseudolactococcus reticulitermitis]|uniref:Uncharacterized protein n=1 Tax=Pseudolactococcus reticulitermitis TaxID=2025039 RepID=A0A224XCA3_9LACT|nr:hypothetical protein [Lactococcus reticulitermitis]GAX47305.1 hypothetical protein RsY01_904 [Lactococcus reticulitermitis]
MKITRKEKEVLAILLGIELSELTIILDVAQVIKGWILDDNKDFSIYDISDLARDSNIGFSEVYQAIVRTAELYEDIA